MKRLIKTSVIFAALIGIGFVTSVIINYYLNNHIATARERGFREGHTQGYEAGLCDGVKDGYQEGSKIGYEKATEGNLGDDSNYGAGFYFTYNPTYDEVRENLVENNKTTAMEINSCAEANGIRTAYVRCQIARKAAERSVYVYNLIVFDTLDKGAVFIRPRSNEEIKVEVGKSYSELNGFPTPSYDDTITKITIFW